MNHQTQRLNWDVVCEPLLLANRFSGKKAVLRNDTNEVLGIVGQDYKTFSNEQFFAFARALAREGGLELKDFIELRGGRVVLAYLENKVTNHKKAGMQMNGFEMKEYLVLGNSHDGTKPFYVGTASRLIRCENQFYSTLKVFSKKHNSVLEINQINVQNVLLNYRIKRKNLYESFQDWDTIQVNEVNIEKLVNELHKMLQSGKKTPPKEGWGKTESMLLLKKSIAKEMALLGENAFGLFNGVTWYTTHEMRSAGSAYASPEGTAHRINQMAFHYCLQLKNTHQRRLLSLS